jgi:UDP-N-acetylmuramate--alanine ligase
MAGAATDAGTPRAYRPRPGSIPTLEVPDATAWTRVHMVGIGGAGMSGLGRLLLARGVEVSGSDLKDSRVLEALRAAGAYVVVGHDGANVAPGVDAVIRSSAIPRDNPEVRAAAELDIPGLTRAQVLAAVMRGQRGVAVAGTHGKTTTTSMIAVALSRAGLDPSYVIGGDLNESGSGAEHGSGDVFVAESDESDGSFLLLSPEIGVITNVEEDHLDHYEDREEIEAAFAAFAIRCERLVAFADDPGVRRALSGVERPVVWYGFGPEADVTVSEPELGPDSARATVSWNEERVSLELAVPGRHNLQDGAAAVAVAVMLGVSLPDAARALRSFSGVRRRFERKGEVAGAEFVDDYAHHPTEVRATIEAARPTGAPPRRRLLAVFQPHRYTRTRAMWREFGASLSGADIAVITDVYPAGETPIPGVSGKLVVDALTETGAHTRVVYLPRRLDVAPFLANEVRQGDLVLTLGAGDVTMLSEETIRLIRQRMDARYANGVAS